MNRIEKLNRLIKTLEGKINAPHSTTHFLDEFGLLPQKSTGASVTTSEALANAMVKDSIQRVNGNFYLKHRSTCRYSSNPESITK